MSGRVHDSLSACNRGERRRGKHRAAPQATEGSGQAMHSTMARPPRAAAGSRVRRSS